MMPTNDNPESVRQRQLLLEELASLEPDFKASVVAAEIAGTPVISQEDIFFRNNSTFRRPLAKDIARVSWNDDDDSIAQLIFDLNREGVYDMLPETMAHAPAAGKKKTDEVSVKRGVILKQEEQAARKFFAPIENELAHRSLYLDILEREILRNNNPQRTRQFFEYFFGDSRILSDRQVLVLIYILPLSHKIRGNPHLIALAISKMLGYKVTVDSRLKMETLSIAGHVPALGAGRVGINTVLNNRFSIARVTYLLTVRGISAKDYPEFIGSGRNANVINFVADYLFPVAAKLSVQLDCAPDEKVQATSSDSRSSYLNFNAYI